MRVTGAGRAAPVLVGRPVVQVVEQEHEVERSVDGRIELVESGVADLGTGTAGEERTGLGDGTLVQVDAERPGAGGDVRTWRR